MRVVEIVHSGSICKLFFSGTFGRDLIFSTLLDIHECCLLQKLFPVKVFKPDRSGSTTNILGCPGIN